MNDFDLYCITCNCSLPIGTNPTRLYCDKCWRLHRKEYNRTKYQQRTYSANLKKFYYFNRVALLSTPYITGKRLMVIKR